MDLFSSMENVLEYSFWMSVRELILVVVVASQVGYLIGRRREGFTDRRTAEESQVNQCVLSLPCSEVPVVVAQPLASSAGQTQDQSLKMVPESSSHDESKSSSNVSSQHGPQLLKTRSQPQPLTSTPNLPKPQDDLTRQFLSQKINIQGQKIQSRGIFHMTFQKASNPKFIRKIEKHQIITDYEIKDNNDGNGQIIPFGSRKSVELTDESSILEISTYENLRLKHFPIIEKRLIKTNEFSKNYSPNKPPAYLPVSPSLCENGKFLKFFINQRKIGQGAFGTVYQVINIFEGKQYAVKKLFISSKNQVGMEKMQLILNESIKEVNILSQYSHPNIVRFYTCWLEMANLDESIAMNRMHFDSVREESGELLSRVSFRKRKSGEEVVEVSYLSSVAEDSGFAFGEESQEIEVRQNAHKKNKGRKMKKQPSPSECQVVSLVDNVENQRQCGNIDSKQHHVSSFVPTFALYIQMQLCKQGSLDKYLQRRKYINRTFAFIVIDQLLKGVQYLHSNGLVHRDLKPGNIMINKKERLIKIGDFGLSTSINEDIQYGKIGTPSYIAPELLEKRSIKKEDLPLIDVYSIGVIFYELLNLFNFATKHEKLQKINNLKLGMVDLHGDFRLEKKLIKWMTKSVGRISIKEVFGKKEYLQLMEIARGDRELGESWDGVEGLQVEERSVLQT